MSATALQLVELRDEGERVRSELRGAEQTSRFLNLVSESGILWKKNTTFFVRLLESTGRFQNIAEVNILMIAMNSSINLYAQLALLAKLQPNECRPSFSTGAVLAP